MIFKYSVKSLVRTPVKTILFLVLLCAVTAFFILGLSMRVSSTELIDQADEKFMTVAELEYIGVDYPNGTDFDADMSKALDDFDYSALLDVDNIISFERNYALRGYIDGFTFAAVEKPYPSMGVIQFNVLHKNGDTITCMLTKAYYSDEFADRSITFTMMANENYNQSIILAGRTYIAHGEILQKGTNVFAFNPMPFDTKLIDDDQYFAYAEKNEILLHRSFMGDEEARETTISWRPILGLLAKGCIVDVTSQQDVLDNIPADAVTGDPNEQGAKNWLWTDESSPDMMAVWLQIAHTYDVRNNSVAIVPTDHLETVSDFHQSKTYIIDGRYYDETDGSDVTVISEQMAKRLNVKVGDKIPLAMHYAKNGASYYESYFAGNGFIHSGEYTVVGIYKSTGDLYTTVYIPQRGADWLPDETITYTLARFVIKNGTGLEFAKQIEDKLASRMTATVYDSGYMNVAAPLKSMRETSTLLLASCALCGACIIFLFSYMYISKQKDSATLMLTLGAGERKARAYLMLCAFLIVIIAVIVGAVGGYFLTEKVLSYAYDNAVANSIIDMRYSSVRTGVGDVAFDVAFKPSYIITGSCAGAVFLISMIFCMGFTNNALASRRVDESKTAKAGLRRRWSVLKSSLRSMVRYGGRSITVVVVVVVIALLIEIFYGTMSGYTTKLDSYYNDIPVKAYYTSLDGKQIDGLRLDGSDAQVVLDSGFVENVNYSYNMKYTYLGKYDVNDRLKGDEYIDVPESPFAFESFEGEVVGWPRLVYTNNINTVSEFFYMTEPRIIYQEGLDSTIFQKKEPYCLVSSEFASENKLELGSKIRIGVANNTGWGNTYDAIDMTIAGIFAKQASQSNIYCPIHFLKTFVGNYTYTGTDGIGYVVAGATMWDEYYNQYDYNAVVYDNDGVESGEVFRPDEEVDVDALDLSVFSILDSISFTLKNTANLSDLKQVLSDAGYSSTSRIGQVRKTVVIDDSALQSSVSGLIKLIEYMEALAPAIFILVTCIGFILSYLLTKSRRAELAIMRSMGSGVINAFFAFFLEQTLLALIGCLIGYGASWLIFGGLTNTQMIGIAIFFGCYALGAALAVIFMNKSSVMKILSAKE